MVKVGDEIFCLDSERRQREYRINVRSMVFLCHHKRTKLTDIFDSKNDKVAMYAHDAHEEESEVAMSLACLESVLWEDQLSFPSV